MFKRLGNFASCHDLTDLLKKQLESVNVHSMKSAELCAVMQCKLF